MKTFLFLTGMFLSVTVMGQDSLLQARIKSLQGKILPFSTFAKQDSLFLICFWSVNSEESITELNSIQANLENWQNIRPFRFFAVCVDEGKAASRMRGIYNMNGWTFESYVDLYGDLRRALHSNNLPQSVILFKNQTVYQQNGWAPGSENYLIQHLSTMKH